MKPIFTAVAFAGLGFGLLFAQRPPSPPPSGFDAAPVTLSGPVEQINYDPEGRINGFLLAPATLIPVPPDWIAQFGAALRPGASVRVTGVPSVTPFGMRVLDPSSIVLAGRTLTLGQPAPPFPYAGESTIRQINYGPQGEINGFLLANGVLAHTPPFGANDASLLKPGARISVSGFAHVTPAGLTVVDVQSLTANGQTLALNLPPAPPPRPRRRLRPGPPPPPPPPPDDGPAAPPPPPGN
jgi:hypothetical protein